MNSLSLLIYAVELISNIGYYSFYFSIWSAVGVAIAVVIWLFSLDHNIENDTQTAMRAGSVRWRNRFIVVFVIAMAFNILMPSRQTAIMMAASEVAEVVVKSEEAKEVMNGAKGAMKEVAGLSSDAVGLLKQYIQNETKKLADELNPPKKAEEPTKNKEF